MSETQSYKSLTIPDIAAYVEMQTAMLDHVMVMRGRVIAAASGRILDHGTSIDRMQTELDAAHRALAAVLAAA